MAVLNFSITIPDSQVTRTAVAVKEYYGNPAMSDAAAIEQLRQEFIVRLKQIVENHDRAAAVLAAQNANYALGAT